MSSKKIEVDSDCESSESSFEDDEHNILDESDDDEIFPRGTKRGGGRSTASNRNKKEDLDDSKESLFRDDDESALQVEDYEASVADGDDTENASEAQDGFDNGGSSYRNYGDESSFVSHAVALGPSSGGSVCSLSHDGGRRLNLTRQSSGSNFSTGSIGSLESLDSCAMDTGGYSSEEEGDEDFVIAVNWTPKNVKGKIGKLPGFGGDIGCDDASLDGVGSCASIKDILPIDCISEDKPSANAQVTVVAAQFDENGELVDKPQMNDLLSKIVQSTQNMDAAGDGRKDEEEDEEEEEAAGNVPKLVSKKGPGFTSALAKKKKSSSASDDPLMNKFLNSKKEKSKPKKSTRGRRGLGGQISHILGSTDSLDHMKFSRNKRVVKTTTRKQPAKPDVEDASVTGDETEGEDELEELAAALLAS